MTLKSFQEQSEGTSRRGRIAEQDISQDRTLTPTEAAKNVLCILVPLGILPEFPCRKE